MNKNILLGGGLALLGVVGVAGALPGAVGAVNTETTVQVTIEGTIAISSDAYESAGPSQVVAINLLPLTTGGAAGTQSTEDEIITVTTNNPRGYKLSLADKDTDTDLVETELGLPVSGGATIATTASTSLTLPAGTDALWGFSTNGGTTFAGVPASDGTPVVLRTTAGPAAGGDNVTDATNTITWGVKANTNQPPAVYEDIVVYTAIINP